VSSPTEGSKTFVRRNPSITSISSLNKEDGSKEGNHEAKSSKKVHFSVDKDPNDPNLLKKNEQNPQEVSKPQTASTAVSKLKMHGKSPIPPQSPMSGILAMIQSPANSAPSRNGGALFTGLIDSV
jgi:hypothetical protein